MPKINTNSEDFAENEAANRALAGDLKHVIDKISRLGGPSRYLPNVDL